MNYFNNNIMDDLKTKVNIKSSKGFLWSLKECESDEVQSLVKNCNISKFLAQILSSRKINAKNFDLFSNPTLKNTLSDPSIIKNMDQGTKKIVEIIKLKKKIGIIGDYDVDGATSTAILVNFFKILKIETEFHIPDRIKEGYGPNIVALRELNNRCDLIITVDCGTTANEVIDQAKVEGIEIIVVDHHQQGKEVPDAHSIINPNQNHDKSSLKYLAAVGVTFFLLISINRKLRSDGFFKLFNEPNLVQFLDLVALGTVCDIVPLKGCNRAIVKQGLKVINNSSNLGIKSLLSKIGIKEEINEFHLGYFLGPRINAGGRVGESSLGVRLLTSEKSIESNVYAHKLDELNIERRKIEKEVEQLALQKVDTQQNIICVHDDNWHPGVIGIVASRISERFSKPAIVISESDDMCKGSCRSVHGVDIGKIIKKSVEEGIIDSGGGHKMAAGLSIKKNQINLFKDFLQKEILIDYNDLTKNYDSEISLSNIDENLYNLIQCLSPFGSGNLKPILLIKKCFIKFPKLVGNNHISCYLSDLYGNSIKAIAFKAFDNNLGNDLLENKGKTFNIVGKLSVNNWNNSKNIQIEIEDIF